MKKDELRCQYLGGDRRRRGTAQKREKRPPHPALGAGEGACSPLRVGEWPPPTWLCTRRIRGKLCIGYWGIPETLEAP